MRYAEYIELLLENPNKELMEVLRPHYDKITLGTRTHEQNDAWEMLKAFDLFYNINQLKKLFSILSYRTHYTGDPEEPQTSGFTAIWAKEPNDKMPWILKRRISDFLSLALTSLNCCDWDYSNNKPSDNYSLIDSESFFKETDNFYTLRLTFEGHYHS